MTARSLNFLGLATSVADSRAEDHLHRVSAQEEPVSVLTDAPELRPVVHVDQAVVACCVSGGCSSCPRL